MNEQDSEDVRRRFAENFRAAMDAKKLTVRGFARMVKTSPSAITYYRTGERLPKYDRLDKICELLNITPDKLLGYDPKSRQNA